MIKILVALALTLAVLAPPLAEAGYKTTSKTSLTAPPHHLKALLSAGRCRVWSA
jgi:hypothetical protein